MLHHGFLDIKKTQDDGASTQGRNFCCERFYIGTKFSKMGLIKTPICSTMSHERLNHCMIFPTHKKEVDKLNLKKLATDFVLNVPKRKKNCSA